MLRPYSQTPTSFQGGNVWQVYKTSKRSLIVVVEMNRCVEFVRKCSTMQQLLSVGKLHYLESKSSWFSFPSCCLNYLEWMAVTLAVVVKEHARWCIRKSQRRRKGCQVCVISAQNFWLALLLPACTQNIIALKRRNQLGGLIHTQNNNNFGGGPQKHIWVTGLAELWKGW